jgi:outer membrane protein OmpA-like peptidoglycan-associated protein
VTLCTATTAAAEPVGTHFELTPFGGWTVFDGDLRFVFGNPLTDDLYVGGRFGLFRGLLGVEAAAGFTPTAEDVPGGEDVDFFHAGADLMFLPWNGRLGGPYLFAGGGWLQLKPSVGDGLDGGALDVGGGVRIWLTDAVGLRAEVRQLYFATDDPVSGDDLKINNLTYGGGVVLALGGTPRDTDADGVPDRKDKCPDTPRGARVNAEGCTTDEDNDKVVDGLDQCSGTPAGATVDVRGCPSDADADGIFDGIDQCADTPRGATVGATGCPSDADGDGVWDGIDQCPDTPRGASIDEKGCPNDSDGDGVSDGLDKCPGTSAGLKVDSEGCPIEVTEKETELMDTGMIRLQNVNFETAKADLLPESLPVLDVVGQVLTKWPELKIEVGGHTDARGSNAYNQRLSEARVKSVLDYVLGKFSTLNREQFTSRGYGEARPIASNRTVEGMARNRRVEFVVLNKDVLKRETERRRLLRRDEPTPGTQPAPIPPTPAPSDTLLPPPPQMPDTLRAPAPPDTSSNR